MADLKSFWNDPPVGNVGLEGDLITERGSDPLIDLGGTNGLTQVLWPNPPVSTPGGEETDNSVSGLPNTPARYQPSEQPPGIPELKDKNPGTIDKQ